MYEYPGTLAHLYHLGWEPSEPEIKTESVTEQLNDFPELVFTNEKTWIVRSRHFTPSFRLH